MKRLVSSLLVASMLVASAPAWADETTTTSPSPPPVVTPISKGQIAPYTGVLMSPEAVATIVAERESAKAAIQLAVQRQVDLDEAKLKFEIDRVTSTCTADKKILQAQIDDGHRKINILNEQLKKTTDGPSPLGWVGIGAGTGVVVTLLTVFVVGQATK